MIKETGCYPPPLLPRGTGRVLLWRTSAQAGLSSRAYPGRWLTTSLWGGSFGSKTSWPRDETCCEGLAYIPALRKQQGLNEAEERKAWLVP